MNATVADLKFEYMNKEAISQYLLCSLCKDILMDPVSTKCEPEPHTFCRQCIEKRLKADQSCPIESCGHKLDSQDLMPVSVIVKKILDDLPVECLSCRQKELKRVDFYAHYNEICPKTSVVCPASDIQCPWTGTRDELQKHLNNCAHNLLKPLIIGLKTGVEQPLKRINQKKDHIEKIPKEKEELKQRVNRQRTQTIGPIKATQPLYNKEDDEKPRITADLQQIIDKLNLQSIEHATLTEDNKQKDIYITALEDRIQSLEDQVQQMLKNPIAELLSNDQQNCSHIYEGQKKNYDGYAATGIFDRINPDANYPGSHDTDNPPPPYDHLRDTGHPVDRNPLNNHLNRNARENSSGNSAQNAYNGPIIVPFILPIQTPISINTNIAGSSNNIATGSNTNVAGGTNNNHRGRGNNNIAGGINNNICGGNNKFGGNNNSISCGSHTNTTTRNNNFAGNHAAGFNHVLDNNNCNDSNNDCGGNRYIAGDTNSNHPGRGNNNLIGGNNKNICGGHNSFDGNNNHISCGSHNNSVPNNIDASNNLNDTTNDENGEGSIDGSAVSAADERRNGSIFNEAQIRQNPDIVSPPADENSGNY